MRFEKTQKDTLSSDTTRGIKRVTSSKHYLNGKGKVTHHPRGRGPMSFVGVDGEGMTVNGTHRYVLFGVGEHQIENENGLQWDEVFDFLYSHFKPGTAYVGFFLGYDFTQILKTLPEDRAWMLLTAEGRALRKRFDAGKGVKGRKPLSHLAPHPVECDGWQFDMLAMKRLRIRPKLCNCPLPTCKCKPKAPWMYINDVGGFFQSSFLTVINPKDWAEGTAVVTAEEYETIRIGKEKRSIATLDDDMRMYNRLENVVLSRVMTVLDKGLQEIGIGLSASKWFGPGQAAQSWLKNESVPNGKEINETASLEMIEAARMSYFGGWFEQFIHGIIPGESYEYDINSAYPSVIAKLPCLLHGEYSRGEGMPIVDDGDLCLVYAKVWSPNIGSGNEKRQYIGAMLHRDNDGGISRPMATEGWFWWDELKAAEKCKLIKALNNRGHQQVMRWVKYRPCDCPPPMAAITGLYQKRLEVGKKSPLGKAAKLVYNSSYGKFAQSVGEPVFGNPIYASRITSSCRTLILDAIASHPRGKADVAMVATDAVYFLSPHPSLPMSDKLGEWDYEPRHNLTLFKPGVYWDDKAREEIAAGKSPHFKARGFVAKDFVANIFRVDSEYRQWATKPPEKNQSYALSGRSHIGWPTVDFTPAFAMVTALQALRRNNWTSAGAVSDASTLTQDSSPHLKRTGFDIDEYDGRIIYRTRPHANIWYEDGVPQWEPSQPYVKRFGMEDPWSDEYKEQLGITEDGNIADILAWILKGE